MPKPAPLPTKRSSPLKQISRGMKQAIRRVVAPFVSQLPDAVANALPALGCVSTRLPDGRKLRLISDGDDGKDYIAYKIAGKRFDCFEPETTHLFMALVAKSNVVFDVGANTGLFALAAAADGGRRVVAFEPVPQIARRLLENVGLNGFRNVTVEAAAVDVEDGELTLFVPATHSSLPTSASAAEGFKTETVATTVPALSLDRYVARHGISCVDLLKIDTETTEDRVLRGAAALLRRDEPAIVCEVLRQEPRPSVAAVLPELLGPCGYRYFWIGPLGLVECESPQGDPTGQYMNYLFITPKRLPHVAHLIAPKSPRLRTA